MYPQIMYKVIPDKIGCEKYMKLLKETDENTVEGTLEKVEMERS